MPREEDIEAQKQPEEVELRLLLRNANDRGRSRTPGTTSHHRDGSRPRLELPPESPPSSGESTPTPSPSRDAPPSRRRKDRRLRRLNTELLEAIETDDFEWALKSLESGASPNATCRLDHVSACHLAACMGADDILAVLINKGAERTRMDRYGRTPLHLAAWGGHNKCVAILLHFPESLQDQLDGEMTEQTETSVRYCCSTLRDDLVNVQCVLLESLPPLPKDWRDSFDHECRELQDMFPTIYEGWTPLHVSSAGAQPDSTRLLLLAGADVHALDERGRTPLDVLGIAYYEQPDRVTADDFLTVLRMLLEAGATQKTMKYGNVGEPASPLHTAVELNCCDAITELLKAGAYAGVFNDKGDTPLHTCVRNQFEEALQALVNTLSVDEEPFGQNVDVKNARGLTVLHAAVIDEWIPGVCAALEAGADVGMQAYDGDTALHAAAALGNAELLQEVLSVARNIDTIDRVNALGETPLFKGIVNGNKECVKILMQEGASIHKTMPGNITVIHRAAEFGFTEILNDLLIADKKFGTETKINALSDEKRQGFGAIHYAALNDRAECVKILLKHGANVRLRTTPVPHAELTALHVSAMLGHKEVVDAILEFDNTTVHEVDGHGWLPIHTASHHGSRETIPSLLQSGADLSSTTDSALSSNRTAIDLLVNNFTRPTEYLEELFDSYISMSELGLQDSNCEVKLDYSVLMPKNREVDQMKVVIALVKTGNRYGQRKLLLHPLVESFLCLKWRALSPFFLAILLLYCTFTMALTNLVIAIFYYEDTELQAPVWLDIEIWSYIMLTTIGIISIKKLIYVVHNPIDHAMMSESWVSTGSVILAASLPFIYQYEDWPRHVATFAILLAWTHLMFLLSRFPKWGYYVLMFSKVSNTVTKILLTFGFLVIGFSLAFMIQFHGYPPFDGPVSSLFKTIVMMTSEFEYEAQFDEEFTHIKSFSLLMVRLIFITFVILASIVLMNLLVGVAVNDINDLETLGHMERLVKQVEFLGTLDSIVNNKFMNKIVPTRFNAHIRGKRNVETIIRMYPAKTGTSKTTVIPKKIKDAIFIKATKKKMINEEFETTKKYAAQIEAIYKATVDKPTKTFANTQEELVDVLGNLDEVLKDAKNKLSNMQDTRVADVARKLECVNKDICQLKKVFTLKRIRAASQ